MLNEISLRRIKSFLSLRALFPFCNSRESGNSSSLSLREAKQACPSESRGSNLNLSGFSLIELMVAIAILAMAIFGIFHAYSVGFMGMADARDRTVATNYAREAMEDVKNMDFDQILIQSRNYINGTKYEREVIVQESTNLKKVTTKVYWKDRNDNTKMVETDMVIHFIETTAGTPTKIILYANPYNVLTEDVENEGTPVDERKSTITAVVKDDKGNTVITWDKNINFSFTGSGDLSPTAVIPVNFDNGKATTTFTSGAIAEEVTITASSEGLTSDSVIIKITNPKEPVKIKLTNLISGEPGQFMTPGSESKIKATIVDAAGDIVTDATNEITFSVSGPGTLSNQSTLEQGVATIDLISTTTPGTITVTASSTGLEPGIINVYTGGCIYLSASPINVPVNEISEITVTTKDVNGVPMKYIGNIDLTVAGYGISPGSGGLPSDPTCSVIFNEESSKTISFIASTVGKVIVTSEDYSPGILTPENELILTIIPELNPDHIKVDADPPSILVGGIEENTSTITARVEDEYYTHIISYPALITLITFTTDKGHFPGGLLVQEINTSSDYVTYENGVATVKLYSSDESETANISVTSDYYGKIISGNTRVGFYLGANRIDLIASPQSILSGGDTCTIIATIKEDIIVTGYEGPVTFTIVEGYPSGVKFTSTNQSSITINASDGVATMVLASKNWVGIAKVRVTASEGLEEELTADILIPVVPNKNLEIFLLYRKIVNPDTFVNYMKYCNPTDGSFEGEWIPDPVNYGKFCVDSNNNLYILDIDGNCIQKKSSRGDPILKSDEIPENSYTIDNNSYTINIGPNGYVYFTLNTDTSMEGPKYCIKKINPNTLIIEDVLYLTIKNTYYGFAIDSDGESTYVYIHNYTNQKIEKWSFKTGSIVDVHNLTNNYILSALAIAGDYIGGVKEDEIVKNAFIINKNLSTSESEFTLSNITEPFYISSIGGDFLFSGLGDSDRVVFGRYGVDNSEKWHKEITEYLPYSDCIIGSYPF